MSLSNPLFLYREGFNTEAGTVIFWENPNEYGFFPTSGSTLLIRIIDVKCKLCEDIDEEIYINFGDASRKCQEGHTVREWSYPKTGHQLHLEYRGSFNNLGIIVRNVKDHKLTNVKLEAKVAFAMKENGC
jgi:hypothetical protein